MSLILGVGAGVGFSNVDGVGGGGPGTGVLDVFPGSIGGFSLRKLRSAYTGPVVELQVSGAVDTDDFYDDAGTLINSLSQTPTQWLVDIGQPANQGLRVKTLYNQSLGATFNIEQLTTGLQPHIYQNGAADYYRMGTYNRITLQWDSYDDALSSTSWAGYNDVSLFIVEELLATEPAHLLIQGTSSSFYRVVSQYNATTANNAGTVYVGGVATGSTNRQQLYADINGVYNGQAIGGIAAQYIDISMPNPGYSTWHLNKYSSGSFFSNECKIAELLMYPSDMTTEVVAISNEQSLYYGLPAPPPWANTYSLDFDGISKYVESPINGTATGAFGSGAAKEFTISFWFKTPDISVNDALVNWGTSNPASTSVGLMIFAQSSGIRYYVMGVWGSSPTDTLSSDTWYHVVLTRTASDDTTNRLTVIGVLILMGLLTLFNVVLLHHLKQQILFLHQHGLN